MYHVKKLLCVHARMSSYHIYSRREKQKGEKSRIEQRVLSSEMTWLIMLS